MKKVVVFDFDDTLTTKDTLLEFIKFAKGRSRLYTAFLLYAPWLVAYKLGMYPNWKVKQQIFSFLFKGMDAEEFARLGREFAHHVDGMLNMDTVSQMQVHQTQGCQVYVISASIEQWVKPWCEVQGVICMATQVEVDADGKLTGRFATKNCYGDEKVARLLQYEPDRSGYRLTAYGDSEGDCAMSQFADEFHWVK